MEQYYRPIYFFIGFLYMMQDFIFPTSRRQSGRSLPYRPHTSHTMKLFTLDMIKAAIACCHGVVRYFHYHDDIILYTGAIFIFHFIAVFR